MERTQENQNAPVENRQSVTLNSLAPTQQGGHFSYLYKKTEKLVTAVYMITNFIKDNEPLKWKFRDNSIKASLKISLISAEPIFDLKCEEKQNERFEKSPKTKCSISQRILIIFILFIEVYFFARFCIFEDDADIFSAV